MCGLLVGELRAPLGVDHLGRHSPVYPLRRGHGGVSAVQLPARLGGGIVSLDVHESLRVAPFVARFPVAPALRLQDQAVEGPALGRVAEGPASTPIHTQHRVGK